MESNVVLKTKELINEFNLNVINKKNANMEGEIKRVAINRAGLELAGLISNKYVIEQVIGFGTKENNWFEEIGKNESQISLKRVVSSKTPLIILSEGISEKISKWILEVANIHNVPVVKTDMHLSIITSTIGTHLGEVFAPWKRIHGSLVTVDGIGIMIIGKSGVGKSEAVIELIQKGHHFVTDDTVILKKVGNNFFGSGPHLTQGILEVRGVGMINIEKIYGVKTLKSSSKVDLVIELVDPNKEKIDFERIGKHLQKYNVLNGSIPLMKLPVKSGRSVSSLIEAASNVFAGKLIGIEAIDELFMRRQKENNG